MKPKHMEESLCSIAKEIYIVSTDSLTYKLFSGWIDDFLEECYRGSGRYTKDLGGLVNGIMSIAQVTFCTANERAHEEFREEVLSFLERHRERPLAGLAVFSVAVRPISGIR